MKRLKQLIKPTVLKHIGRPLLGTFLVRFAAGLKAKGTALPESGLSDNDYFCALAAVLKNPEGLPDGLLEALTAIDEMANPEGREQLELALARASLEMPFPAESSDEDVAMQVWLTAPALLTRMHNQSRMVRLTAFAHFRAKARCGAAPPQPPDTSPSRLRGLAASLDQWFARHQRGRNNTSVELYPIADELWFLVQHGDTFTRRAKIEQRRIEVLHFRPEKDDVVVYSPAYAELRLNARSKSERELYRRQFGCHLWGDAEYFSEPAAYTLEPLRTHGLASLNPAGIEGIRSVTLREIKVALGNPFREITIRQADDLFLCACAKQEPTPIPPKGQLTGATFEFHFVNTPKPRIVKICPPNVLRLGRYCDAQTIHRWTALQGYRT